MQRFFGNKFKRAEEFKCDAANLHHTLFQFNHAEAKQLKHEGYAFCSTTINFFAQQKYEIMIPELKQRRRIAISSKFIAENSNKIIKLYS